MAHFLTLFLLLFLGFLHLTPERPHGAATGTGDREIGLAGPPPWTTGCRPWRAMAAGAALRALAELGRGEPAVSPWQAPQ